MAGILAFKNERSGKEDVFVPLRAIQSAEYKRCLEVAIDRELIPCKCLEGSVVYITVMSGAILRKYFRTEEEGWQYYEDLRARIERD